MDPVSQGLLGGIASQITHQKKLGKAAALIGVGAGLLPDIDSFFHHFSESPLAYIELHRHFTHSLFFIPFGGLLASLPFLMFKSLRKKYRSVILCAMVGYGTHALLDTCTSYGTLLGWPFTEKRYAWDIISIIDPVFTLALLFGFLLCLIKKKNVYSMVALSFCFSYLFFGTYQREQAYQTQRHLAQMRDHQIIRGRVFPTLGNLALWRSVYQHENRFFTDAIHIPYGGTPSIREGKSVTHVGADQIQVSPQTKKLVSRFESFSGGYTTVLPSHPKVMIDIRYSLKTEGVTPLWGFQFSPKLQYFHFPDARSPDRLGRFWDDLKGKGFSQPLDSGAKRSLQSIE